MGIWQQGKVYSQDGWAHWTQAFSPTLTFAEITRASQDKQRPKPGNLDPGDFFPSTRTESGGATLTRQTCQFITNAIIPPFALWFQAHFLFLCTWVILVSLAHSEHLYTFVWVLLWAVEESQEYSHREGDSAFTGWECLIFWQDGYRTEVCSVRDLWYLWIRKLAMWFQFAFDVQTIISYGVCLVIKCLKSLTHSLSLLTIYRVLCRRKNTFSHYS